VESTAKVDGALDCTVSRTNQAVARTSRAAAPFP